MTRLYIDGQFRCPECLTLMSCEKIPDEPYWSVSCHCVRCKAYLATFKIRIEQVEADKI